MYYVGEVGYECTGDFLILGDAEAYALEQSDSSGNAQAIWDDEDNVLCVAVEGELFDKRQES